MFQNNHKRRRWRRAIRWRMEAGILYLFWLLVRGLRPARASAAGKWLFVRLGPRTRKHTRIIRNLELAFPRLGADEITRLSREIWGNFGSVLAEYPHLYRFGGNPSMMRVEIDAETQAIIAAKIPAIYITAHLGNWELVASAIAATGVPLSAVYAPQHNPLLERMLQSHRRALGCRFISKHNAIRWLAREIRSGRSIGMLPDQRMDSGKSLPFFGLDTPTPISPAWLSIKNHCPLIPVHVERTADARYHVVFHRPLQIAGESSEREKILQITTAINRLFEDWIQQQPGQWLCIKRRWPITAYKSR